MVLTEGREKTYQEIAAISDSLGLRQENIVPSLENQQNAAPNQYKALLAMGAAPNQISVGAGSLQAVRVKLEDIDAASPAKSINVIRAGDEFPPYTQTSVPMRIFSKFATFWMNYKQLAVIEYLVGFGFAADFSSLGTERWEKFTSADYNARSGEALLCRVRPIDQQDVESRYQGLGNFFGENQPAVPVSKKELFNLEFYNQYFILEAGN